MPERNLLTLVNSRGRVLLSVNAASERAGTYLYEFEGGGGCGDKASILRTAGFVRIDARSARASGEWAAEFNAMPNP